LCATWTPLRVKVMTASSSTPRVDLERRGLAQIELLRRQQGNHGLDLLTWTIVNRPFLKPGAPFDIITHAYLAALYREQAQTAVVYKASQMGASEYAISFTLHAADQRQATCLYIFPTDTHVSDFSSARLGPALESSPYLASVVVDGSGTEGKRGADRVTLKRVRDRFIYLRGGQVKTNGQAPQLKSIDVDVLILDEVDEMDPRAPSIAQKRLGHSAMKEERWISTPTYPGVGIHAKWLESDQREWFVRCPHCGERQMMTINQVVAEWDDLGRPVGWHDYIACIKCGKALDRLSKGEWVATCPGREVVGYHLTKLFSPLTTLPEIVKALNTTDETKRREAYNQDLGEPYTPRGGQITDDTLDGCRRDYGHRPVTGEDTVMGADVGKIIHAVIRGPQDPETGERPQRWAGEVESFEALGRLIRQYHVRRAVVDALPETRKARELQVDFAPTDRSGKADFGHGVIWLAYYVTQKTGSRKSEPVVWNAEDGIVSADRTRTMDETMARFYEQENTLPAYARDVRDYYDHLKAPVRVVERGPGGEPVATYVESRADHLAHAENYCTIASHIPPVKAAGAWGRKKK